MKLKEEHEREMRESDMLALKECEIRERETHIEVNTINTKINIALGMQHTYYKSNRALYTNDI